MNICYGIITHKNSNILRNTINLLYRNNNILLHIDKKADESIFEEYKSMVEIIDNNVNVQWGTYSQIESTLNLIKASMKYKFDYLCIISGDDMPLKSDDKIKEFFDKNKGKEFIGIDKNIGYKEIENRVKYKHNGYQYKKNKNILEKILAKLQKKLSLQKKNDKFKLLPKLYKGPNWFCVSYEFCEYLLEYLKQNKWYEDAFKDSLCGDEVFFQTILMNSRFKSNVYKLNEFDDNHMALRYIDWTTGPEYPRLLDESDFDKIKENKNSDCIFARKFKETINIDNFNKEFTLNQRVGISEC